MKSQESARTALVLCGGGSRGAAEIGFYQALCELDIKVNLILDFSQTEKIIEEAYLHAKSFLSSWIDEQARKTRQFAIRRELAKRKTYHLSGEANEKIGGNENENEGNTVSWNHNNDGVFCAIVGGGKG